MLLQGSRVTVLKLALSFHALEAITSGAELIFEVDDITVHLRCDNAAFEFLQQQMQQRLLELVPTDGTKH